MSTTTAVQLEQAPTDIPNNGALNIENSDSTADAAGTLPQPYSGRPSEFATLAAECSFIVICSMGQLLFAICLVSTFVNQVMLVEALQISRSLTPWLIGSFLVANGVSVVISGSLADLMSPKWLMVGAFVWSAAWNLVGVWALDPSRLALYFIVRAMLGLAVGTLCSAAMSMLGRVYRPGVRKNRVFALMGAMIPVGVAVGALQGGALSMHLEWVFGSTAILAAACAATACWCIPPLPVASPGFESFDYPGAAACVAGCGLLIFGLTQGDPTHWTPYTYALVIVGVAFLGLFILNESRAKRPLIDNRLWLTPGFLPLMLSYFLGYGGWVGAWQYYAVSFLLTIQGKSPIITACCLIPIGLFGVLASWVVSRTLHVLPGHYVMIGSMIAFALGPVFFLPQTSGTLYWALSFPGIALSTFGPDMTFASVAVFITSNVPKSYQGAAGSLLITAQNISTATMAAIAGTIASNVTRSGNGELDLGAYRAVWWFSLGVCLLGAIICIAFVRIPKSEEKEHIS